MSIATLAAPQTAQSKPNAFDLPGCSKFKTGQDVQYCDVRVGSGAMPEPGDLIEVDYTARAVSTGNVFEGSRSFRFTLGQDEVSHRPGMNAGHAHAA